MSLDTFLTKAARGQLLTIEELSDLEACIRIAYSTGNTAGMKALFRDFSDAERKASDGVIIPDEELMRRFGTLCKIADLNYSEGLDDSRSLVYTGPITKFFRNAIGYRSPYLGSN